MTGTYNSFSGPLEFESQLERDAYYLLDFEPSVSRIQAQPLRLGNYTPDCLITTKSGLAIIAEIKYKQELFEKWQLLQRKFDTAEKLAAERGALFGFITDEIVYADRNRLDILKWIRFMARDAGNKIDGVTCKEEIRKALLNGEESSFRTVAERIGIDHSEPIQLICFLIASKMLYVKSIPNQDPLDCILSVANDQSNSTMQIVMRYHDFVASIGGKTHAE